MLDQSTEKKAGIRKQVFLRGRQKDLDDVICFIANIIAMGRFWVKVTDKESPMVLNNFMDNIDLIYLAEYRSFDDKFKGSTKYMAHTLAVYIFNIFALFVKTAKTQKVIREFQVSIKIKFRHLKIVRVMTNNLMEQLILCVYTRFRSVLFFFLSKLGKGRCKNHCHQ